MSQAGGSKRLSRREFLAGGALLGFALQAKAMAAGQGDDSVGVVKSSRPDAPYELAKPENIIYSVCLQCNTGCGIKCKIQDGIVAKIDGNPYSPWCLLPHLDESVSAIEAAKVDGSICPKGQAGLQTAYDPYRLRKVLKRAGRRGENKWITISFEQAIREICEGGRLFAYVPGEEDREVEGLNSLVALRDPKVAEAMAKKITEIWNEKDRTKKAELVAAFQKEFASELGKLIDPDHPDLGPRNNQVVVAWGRAKGGRGEWLKRFATALGSTNAHGHTTVCQGSLYFTCKAISEQYEGGKFTNGQKFYWQADTENAEFILFVGANLFEANYGPPNRTVRLTENLASGRTRIAVADPRFSKLASKAWKWLPLQPGTDAALALAMIRWILDHEKYDARFLSAANKVAAKAAGETSWTNASWLVEVKDGKPGKFVRAADHGLATAEKRQTKDGKEYEEKFLVVMENGVPKAFEPNDEQNPVVGDLFVDTSLPDGTHVKSGLQILAESARQHSIEQWAEIAGVRPQDVIAVARELTSHGKRAVVDIHRGPAQHTNGFYNVLAWMTLNMLIGNYDAKGGLIKASTYNYLGKGGPYNLEAQPGAIKPFGISSIRHGIDYEKTTLFAGYPAKRNWYPLSSDVYEEIIPSIGDAYPYPVKALFFYMGAPNYALPAGHTNTEILCDVKKLPLFVASDIIVGSTSMYADYIFPDLSFLERWEFQGSHPNVPQKVQPVRQPVMAPIPEECTVFGKRMPICFEAMVLGIAEYLNLPGFGPNGFGEGLALEHPDDFYLRAVANLAFGEAKDGSQAVPEASDAEVEVFLRARRHLPSYVFEEARWKAVAGEQYWRRVITVLNRGGRWESYSKAWKGDKVAHPYAALLNLYQEKTAVTIHSGTGQSHFPVATYVPIRSYTGKDLSEYRQIAGRLQLITHRTIVQTKSRTIVDPWLTPLMPENGILIHPSDAEALGLKRGDLVRVKSATNREGVYLLGNGKGKPMVGKLIPTETIRPGVVSFALGFGHWATGASDLTIDEHTIRGEARRAAGIHANAAMWVDPDVKNTCLFDPVGGSVSFYDTWVTLERA
ncbi:MAG: molybdopterin oxidoreductase [Candidatus Hydrogenedentota bacterium]|jgi:anaerobic selenocysteine-containing dehydrogenase|uniref:Tetrathionate reductase subunit A n=1 Tax=Sumerlaea chitinivorans TaxID=2250252 RepID=A0A2Z4Y7E8_SUMC1|nr:Tetrathionate reductase subunit A [Candidatus Sumerlaea chitinivorans]RMH30057.1 MAG: molybdopterin oxidoreductase [Candidatus Hydrogenedentota bacterium]GIX43965.1 MAG: molybdopterin oxidoreductase [Candidatus Sumerlaea sp.]